MSEVRIQGWLLECDLEATRRAYALISIGDPETCGCLYCQNFVAARSLAYPEAALWLYELLGINHSREAETYEVGTDEDGLHLYGGWHHFVGRIDEYSGVALYLTEQFSISFHESRSCAEPVFDNQPLVQVEFFTRIPWVLADRPEVTR